MNSSAWQDEKLTTIMGSYAQLKHDMILYSKQSFTTSICSTPIGYVEPYPEFYQLLSNVGDYFKNSIIPLEIIGYNLTDSEYYYFNVLDKFHNATSMLANISIKELKKINLDDAEKMFIIETYNEEAPTNLCGDTGSVRGWLAEIIKILDVAYNNPESLPNSRVSLVADIHTDLNYGSILHSATGLFEPIIALVPGWNGEEIAVVGPVFSYYEFKLKDYQRLDDNDWRGILKLWLDCKDRSKYDFDLFRRGYWTESYMVSMDMTNNRLFNDNTWFSPPTWFANVSSSDYGPQDPESNKPFNYIIVILFAGFIGGISIIYLIYRKKRV